jgi:hypothetical protein
MVAEGVIGLCAVTLVTVMVASLVSLMRRFRCATGVLRQQMKWFVGAAALFGATFLVEAPLWNTSREWAQVAAAGLFAVGAIALPIATGVAILRYRLYEIDVIIQKTLVYTAVIGSLALAYLAGIYLMDNLLQTLTGQSSALAVTLSTLAVAAAFRPLQRRIQRAVDHRFYRRKYDAAETLAAFAGRLRDQIELDALSSSVLAVVTATLQPSHASLSLLPTKPHPLEPGRRDTSSTRSAQTPPSTL